MDSPEKEQLFITHTKDDNLEIDKKSLKKENKQEVASKDHLEILSPYEKKMLYSFCRFPTEAITDTIFIVILLFYYSV